MTARLAYMQELTYYDLQADSTPSCTILLTTALILVPAGTQTREELMIQADESDFEIEITDSDQEYNQLNSVTLIFLNIWLIFVE